MFQKRSMNKPISASGLLKQLSIGGVRKEPRIVPKDAAGLGVLWLLAAEVEGDAEGNILNERFSSTIVKSHKGNQSSD